MYTYIIHIHQKFRPDVFWVMIIVYLVGGWTHPIEKYDRQIGSFPQVGVKIKNMSNHHLDIFIVTIWLMVSTHRKKY